MSRENALTGTRCDVCGRRATLLFVRSSGATDESGAPIYDWVADLCRAEMHTLREIIEAVKRREADEAKQVN